MTFKRDDKVRIRPQYQKLYGGAKTGKVVQPAGAMGIATKIELKLPPGSRELSIRWIDSTHLEKIE